MKAIIEWVRLCRHCHRPEEIAGKLNGQGICPCCKDSKENNNGGIT